MNNPIEQACIGQKIVTSPQYPRDKGEKNFIRGVSPKPTKPQYTQRTEPPKYWDKDNIITLIIFRQKRDSEIPKKIIHYWEI